MKYFTQEWYEMMQHTYLPVRVSAKAEFFSEEYFQALYRRKRREWLKDMREGWEEDIIEGREEEPWNEENEREEFERYFRNSISTMQDILPEKILSMVADIRVLALRIGSRKVREAIDAFCRDNERKVKNAFRDYNCHLAALQKKYDLPFIRHLEFHDWVVDSVETQDNLLRIRLQDPCDEGAAVFFFENSRILRLDEQVSGGQWLYEEFHETPHGFELHALCFNWDFEEPLGEMIVDFKNAIIQENQPCCQADFAL